MSEKSPKTPSSAGAGHNRVVATELLGFVERIERLRAEKQKFVDDEKVVKAEARAAGYEPKAIAYVIRQREKTPSERQDDDALRDLYMEACGMGSGGPLFRLAGMLGGDALAREQVIERMKAIVPADGEIIVKIGEPMRLWRDKDGTAHAEPYEEPAAVPATTSRQPLPSPSSEPVPDCTEDQAEELGGQAYQDDKPVIANPFPHNDARRPRWDLGWRQASGSDGMGPEDE